MLLVLMLMLSSINVAFAYENSKKVIKVNGYTRRYTTFYEYSNYTGQIGQTIYSYDFH